MSQDPIDRIQQSLRKSGRRAPGSPPLSDEEIQAYNDRVRRRREDKAVEDAKRALPQAEINAREERERTEAERNRAGYQSENQRTGRDEHGRRPQVAPLGSRISTPARLIPPQQAANPVKAPAPVRPNRIPFPRQQNPNVEPLGWVPDPNTVLVLGGGLILLTLFSHQGGITNFIALIWNQSEGNAGAAPLVQNLLVESGFVVVLFVLSNLSDTLARAAVLFELGLYLLWIIANPGVATNLATLLKNATATAHTTDTNKGA